METQIIDKNRVDFILSKAIERDNEITIMNNIDEALIIMLSISNYFKWEMDYKTNWHIKNHDRVERQLNEFKKEQGIYNSLDEAVWAEQNGPLKYIICIDDLLLHTLYTLNGTYYRINDRDYTWEEEFHKIFVDMPYGREYEVAIIKFLLLPLYNYAHDTNYKLL